MVLYKSSNRKKRGTVERKEINMGTWKHGSMEDEIDRFDYTLVIQFAGRPLGTKGADDGTSIFSLPLTKPNTVDFIF